MPSLRKMIRKEIELITEQIIDETIDELLLKESVDDNRQSIDLMGQPFQDMILNNFTKNPKFYNWLRSTSTDYAKYTDDKELEEIVTGLLKQPNGIINDKIKEGNTGMTLYYHKVIKETYEKYKGKEASKDTLIKEIVDEVVSVDYVIGYWKSAIYNMLKQYSSFSPGWGVQTTKFNINWDDWKATNVFGTDEQKLAQAQAEYLTKVTTEFLDSNEEFAEIYDKGKYNELSGNRKAKEAESKKNKDLQGNTEEKDWQDSNKWY